MLDFGISRFLDSDDEQTRRGMVMGTPEFMAPEQITAPDSVDRRADIWALGVILYEMLEARRPFPSDTDPRALLHRIVHEEPPALTRDGIPHDLHEIILEKLLAKDPAHRFQSMSDVEASLSTFITQDNMRRRRTPLSMPIVDADDLARRSDLIPRAMGARNTPWPNSDTLPVIKMTDPRLSSDPTLQPIALTAPPPANKPWLLYGIAGAGLLVGVLGLGLGMRGGSSEDNTKTALPAPPAAAPAAATQPVASKIAVKIDANVPDARVTFRRRLSAAPATMEIATSDIVELVEVSAPGHKTVRYWLTFDRATKLTATLSKGTGLVEATEEQTLVALGEVSAPTTVAATAPTDVAKPAGAPVVAMATPAVAAAAMTVPQPERAVAEPTAVPTPRKIGKGTDEPIAPTSVEQVKDEQKPEPAVAKPELPEQPKVALDHDNAPKPAPTEPEKLEKPTDEKSVLPEVVKPVVRPAIDQGTLAAVVGKNRPGVLKCFAEAKKQNAKLKGTLTLSLTVDASGKVARVQVQSTITGNPMVAACVVKAANTWRFPARAGGDLANVAYPFVIN